MISDLNKSREERKAKGEAVGGTLHMTTNHWIEFIDEDHARIHNYWLTAFVPPPAAPGAARTPASGRTESSVIAFCALLANIRRLETHNNWGSGGS
jgi:hypothetical protein